MLLTTSRVEFRRAWPQYFRFDTPGQRRLFKAHPWGHVALHALFFRAAASFGGRDMGWGRRRQRHSSQLLGSILVGLGFPVPNSTLPANAAYTNLIYVAMELDVSFYFVRLRALGTEIGAGVVVGIGM